MTRRKLFRTMGAAVRIAKSRGGRTYPLVTPCCRASSTLEGEPAPQYHCDDCGKIFTSLEPFERR